MFFKSQLLYKSYLEIITLQWKSKTKHKTFYTKRTKPNLMDKKFRGFIKVDLIIIASERLK